MSEYLFVPCPHTNTPAKQPIEICNKATYFNPDSSFQYGIRLIGHILVGYISVVITASRVCGVKYFK